MTPSGFEPVIECGSTGFIENVYNYCHKSAEGYLKINTNFKSWYYPEGDYWVLQDGDTADIAT